MECHSLVRKLGKVDDEAGEREGISGQEGAAGICRRMSCVNGACSDSWNELLEEDSEVILNCGKLWRLYQMIREYGV